MAPLMTNRIGKVALLLATIMVVTVRAGGLRSKAGDEPNDNVCVPCSYLGMEDLCLPGERLPHGSRWTCQRHEQRDIEEKDVWDCLNKGSDGSSCHDNSGGACIWCAEPIYGLCVTPGAADTINNLPFFDCNLETSEAQ